MVASMPKPRLSQLDEVVGRLKAVEGALSRFD